MKIAQLTGYFDPDYYSSNELFLCKELTRIGYSVTVFTTTRQPKWQTIERRWKKNLVENMDGFVVKRIPPGIEVGTIATAPTLFSAFTDEEFDIIHSHDFFSTFSLYGAILTKAKSLPLLLTQHNDQYPSTPLNHLLYRLSILTTGKYVLRSVTKIIALTKDIKLHLAQVGATKEKIEIVPNAVDTEKFSPKNKNLLQEKWGITSPVVLFVGRITVEKGVESLLLAFSRVVKKVPNVKLVIVGRGPEEETLKRLQTRFSIPNVLFLGQVENEIMPDVYVGADVLVLPSTREPFGNVVLEAMASGKPVVGSYVGGMKDTIIHGVTGYHVQSGNIKQLTELILKILLNSSLQERLGENARERATSHYRKELIIKKIVKIYEESQRKS